MQVLGPRQTAKLTASNGTDNERFGRAFAISNNTVIVGAWQDYNINGYLSGSAYIFKKNAGIWTEVTKLSTSDGGANFDPLGWSVAISGSTAIVGVRHDDDNGTNSGSAYIYKEIAGTWTQTAKLNASDGASNDRFGQSVAISGSIILVGAEEEGASGSNPGSAYIFKENAGTWTQTAKLTATDEASNDRFGHSVAISDSIAMVGAYFDDEHVSDSGSAYVFEKDQGGGLLGRTQKAHGLRWG